MSTKTLFSYPGTISAALRDGQYPGCKAVWFWTVAGYNKFFTEEPGKPGHGLLVVDAQVRPYFFGLFVGVACMYTTQLSPEDAEDMTEVSRELEFAMAKRKQERAAAREEAHAVQAAANQEMARLAAVGSKYEARVKGMRAMSPSDSQRKELESMLNAGDPEVLFADKLEAFKAGYVSGHNVASAVSKGGG